LESGIFSGKFGAVFRYKSLGQAFPLHHALHGAPVGVIPDEPFHHKSFTMHVDRNLRTLFEVEALAYGFGYRDLPFR
jgi:hypothetical protein